MCAIRPWPACRPSAFWPIGKKSDPLKTEAEFDAIKAGAEPDYGAWITKMEEIKSRYPIPDTRYPMPE